jgi:hypothetical protein
MLGVVGIRAYAALLTAQDTSPIHDLLPRANQFTHCIALADVGGKDVWLDATSESCAYGNIPAADRGADALVIRDGSAAFKIVPPFLAEENGVNRRIHAALKPDGSATLYAESDMRGAEAEQYRAAVRQLTTDQRREMMERWARDLAAGGVLRSYMLADPADNADPYVIRLVEEAPALAKRAGDLLLLPATLGGHVDATNPFPESKRVWPVVNERANLQQIGITVTLPDGCSVDSVPADVDLATPLAEFRRSIAKSADGKELLVAISILGKQGRVPAAQYRAITEFGDALQKAVEEQIVLRPGK